MSTAVAGTARAQGFLTPFIGYNFGGDAVNCLSLRNCDEKHKIVGVSLGKTHGVFGTEQDIAYARHFFGDAPDGGSMLTAMSNFLVVAPLGPVQPYGLLGLGLMRPHTSAGAKNALGYDIGAGVNLFFTKRFGLRGDVRRMRTLQNVTLFIFSGEKLEFWRASLGLTFR
jgi:hypothetical protein